MIFSDTEMRELGRGTTYNTHNTTSLIRTLKYVSDILQTEEAFTVKGYKHTHTLIKIAHQPFHMFLCRYTLQLILPYRQVMVELVVA